MQIDSRLSLRLLLLLGSLICLRWEAHGQVSVFINTSNQSDATLCGGMNEHQLAFDIGTRVGNILSQAQIATTLSYGGSAGPSGTPEQTAGLINARDQANQSDAILFTSIHVNAGGGNGGLEALYNPNKTYASKNLNSATRILNGLVASLQRPNRGLQARTNLLVLNGTLMPASLPEVLFIDVAADCAILATEGGRTSSAQGIANGIIAHIEADTQPPEINMRDLQGAAIPDGGATSQQDVALDMFDAGLGRKDDAVSGAVIWSDSDKHFDVFTATLTNLQDGQYFVNATDYKAQVHSVSFGIADPYFLVENEKLIFSGLARKTRKNWRSRSFIIGAQLADGTADFGVALT